MGTGDDSGPYPCLRALPLACCSCRALFAMPYGPAGTDKAAAEQASQKLSGQPVLPAIISHRLVHIDTVTVCAGALTQIAGELPLTAGSRPTRHPPKTVVAWSQLAGRP